MSALRIGVDIDDVLYPWYDSAHRACEQAGITNGVTPTSWAPFTEYGCTDQAWFDTLLAAGIEVYVGAPLDGAVEALARLQEHGHEVHLVTARGGFTNGLQIKAWTIEWLDAWQVPHDALHFCRAKDVVQVDAFVDDRPQHCDELERAGVPTWLVDRPYNREHDHPRRVQHVGEFVDAVLGGAR